MDQSRKIRRAAVLGAGVMGAQLAAHLGNAGVPVLLFDLGAEGTDPNAIVNKAIASLGRLHPSPLADSEAVRHIHPANYDRDLAALGDCDLVIEAVTERIELKRGLYGQIIPHLGTGAILASNTSGLGIARLAAGLPDALRRRFIGAHFFNPPRYMHLLELIPHAETAPEVAETLEAFFTTVLGKGVVYAKDTPSFIANRIGVFSLLSVLHHAQRLCLAPDLVDKLTGPGIGHPKSATFRTADVVGLDTFAHVVHSLWTTLPEDPWHRYFQVPKWIDALIEAGALGQKAGAGVYRKQGREILVFDSAVGDYRPVHSGLDEGVCEILEMRDAGEKFLALEENQHPQADFLVAIFRDLFHYSAVMLEAIAETARDVDLAMRWGYGWSMGPFEAWQAAGWRRVALAVDEDIQAGRTMAAVPLPDWVLDPQRDGVSDGVGSWSPAAGRCVARSQHTVYRRQLCPPRVLGEPEPESETLFDNGSARLWHTGDGIAVLSFRTKMHSVDDLVLDSIQDAVGIAEEGFEALLLWQPTEPFSAGANLAMVLKAIAADDYASIRAVVEKFQSTSQRLRHSLVPTVAVPRGLVLGGGCELMMHCDATVAALESYIGLVEVGVGLVPAGGGCKEMVLRAEAATRGGRMFPVLAKYFECIGMAKTAGSALEAREWNYLRPSDPVVMNADETLYVAKQHARALYAAGYRPPRYRDDIAVAGADGASTLKAQLLNMREGGFISAHDYRIGSGLADILCAGDLDPGTLVDEDWFLSREVDLFMELLGTPETRARIAHLLETGKPLRN